ncbi:Cobalt/magnesium transport protein CorA [bacterium HR15]|uniref:Metal ion transporter, MIT family n=1 Tax=uncultured prokaryote TaxID=198431 RepID=H5S9I6_9ZZZZ|nr:metal ion transporter, MIT family [uncultured prokaryote]GBC91991.1 Cobalt/magnesium transport protein CorA [bacterium HR15]
MSAKVPKRPAGRAQKAGLPPGTPVYIGQPKVEKVHCRAYLYSPTTLEERSLHPAECGNLRQEGMTLWLDVVGLHDVDAIRTLAEAFQLHPLTVEDILNTHQRPKAEEYEGYLYLVMRMLTFDLGSQCIESEQVSLIIGADFVLSFQEREGDVFEPVRERLRSAHSRLRTRGADFLAYSLIDAIVDHYFVVLEHVGDQIEKLEGQLMAQADGALLQAIQMWRHALMEFSHAAWPLREAIGWLARGETPSIQEATRLYLRDVYDHLMYVIENLTTYREMLSNLVELHLSATSNRLNEVMKMLTIIATVFMPLSFIASIYGMNFEYMPELGWRWGYPATLLLMLIVAGGLLYYFRRRGWL